MTLQMSILHLTDTGHVLAGFTRTAEPAQPDTAADAVVGAGMHVRVGTPPNSPGFDSLDFVLPASRLKLIEAAADFSLLAAPHSYFIGGNSQPSLFTRGAISIPTPHPPHSFTVSAPTLPGNPQFVLLVQPWSGGPTQYRAAPPLIAGGTSVDLGSLPSGQYHVLVCVPEYPVSLTEIQI